MKNDRSNIFAKAVASPITIKDSRFGIRKMPKGIGMPSVFSYSSPGKGPNGEHVN